jgi:hypothetical protein
MPVPCWKNSGFLSDYHPNLVKKMSLSFQLTGGELQWVHDWGLMLWVLIDWQRNLL